MKATRTGTKWAHVSCALWIPEVWLAFSSIGVSMLLLTVDDTWVARWRAKFGYETTFSGAGLL